MSTRAIGHRIQRALLSDLAELGRSRESGGYRRYAWTDVDARLFEWFADQAQRRGLDLVVDRAGNQWAWWGDPDLAPGAGIVTGSHLDSVPDGGALDGPLGVVSAFAALDVLRAGGHRPRRPLGIVAFRDEEGARFGVACIGSRVLTGSLSAGHALALRDRDGVTLSEAMRRHGHRPEQVGADPETLRRVGTFVELHVEQGRALAELGRPVAVGTEILGHGRWRLDLTGQANHAGTTRLEDRRDPMLALAEVIHAARASAAAHDCVATVGKVEVHPNGVNAIPSSVSAWLDVRGPVEGVVRAVAEEWLSREGLGSWRSRSPTPPCSTSTWLDRCPTGSTTHRCSPRVPATTPAP
jgi:N-carbamoyl-L-amino-acid hydrolase